MRLVWLDTYDDNIHLSNVWNDDLDSSGHTSDRITGRYNLSFDLSVILVTFPNDKLNLGEQHSSPRLN